MDQAEISQQMQEAVVLHNQGELDQAEAIYRKVLAFDADNFYALNFCGCICREKKRFDEGLDLLSKAVSLQPSHPDAVYNLGNLFKDNEHWDEAILCYEKALCLRAEYPEALNNLGVCLQEVERYEHSEFVLRRAVSILPGYTFAWLNLGNALKVQGKLEESIVSYQKVIELKPDFADAHLRLGMVLAEDGELKDAIASYRRAIEMKSEFTDAYLYLALALQKEGKEKEAIDNYLKAIELDSSYESPYLNLATLLIRRVRILEALNILRDGNKNCKNSPQLKHLLGTLLLSQGQTQEGDLCLREAFSLDSSFAKKINGFSLRSQEPEDFWRSHHSSESLYLHYWEQNPRRRKLASAVCALDGVGSVLECGCNVGGNLFAINAVNDQIKLSGVDMNPSPIEFGRKSFAELGIDVDMSVLRLQDLSKIPSKSVDLAYTNAVLQHIPPEFISDILSNMIRISRRYVLLWELHAFSPAEAYVHQFFIDSSTALDGRWMHNYWDILGELGVERELIAAQQVDPKICLGKISDFNCIFSFPVP